MTKFTHALIAAAVLAIGTSASAATNLVTNGDFETGDFSGWTLSGDTSATGVNGGQAYFGSVYSDAYLTQTLDVSSTGTYIVSFDLSGYTPYGSDFTLSFGGTQLLSETTAADGTVHYSFEVTGGNGELTIAAMDQPAYWYLDNVSVTAAVPEASSSAMLLAGVGLMGFAARRRRSAR